MIRHPAAFMSYVRLDDHHENGRITDFKNRLSGEVKMQAGGEFDIFQDLSDIAWGEPWQRRIEESLDAITFLIPILTPRLFQSHPCRTELERFLQREKQLRRDDLILPVYYLSCPVLEDAGKDAKDPLASVVASRQYADWRELRFEPFTSPQVGRTFSRMAEQIIRSIRSIHPPRTASTRRMEKEAPTSREENATQLIDHTQRPANKTEPPTLVVDSLCRGDHSTLAHALEAAKPGNRILVRPGLYRESIVIDKPIEIIGDGKPGEVVIEAAGEHTVLFRTNMGRITNLTLRQVANEKPAFCINIAQGRLDLEDCDITSQNHASVAIHDGADPRLLRNRIHDGKNGGILAYRNAQGTLENNEIFANGRAAVEIKESSTLILRRNRIHDGEHYGVYVHTDGRSILEDNEIFGNAFAGVEITQRGRATLYRNRIHDGRHIGVHVHTDGHAGLEENEIFDNAFAGVEVKEGGNCTLRRNRIYKGKHIGINVHTGGRGLFEDNEIFENAYAGMRFGTAQIPLCGATASMMGGQAAFTYLRTARGLWRRMISLRTRLLV